MKRLRNKLQRRLNRWLQWIWQQEGTPGQRARGLAAGVFCGCFPFFGFQTLLGIGLASVVRGNHLLAAAGTWISNPFTYVPLFWFNYRLGALILGEGSWLARAQQSQSRTARHSGVGCDEPSLARLQPDRSRVWWP